MLATSVAAGALWLGMEVAQGGAIYVSAEDEIDEVHCRLGAICKAERLNLADLERLEIIPLAGVLALQPIPTGRRARA